MKVFHPGFELRHEIEGLVRAAELPAIILRPATFLENLVATWSLGALRGERAVACPLPARLRSSWMAVADLGAYRRRRAAPPRPRRAHARRRRPRGARGDPARDLRAQPRRFAPEVARGIARGYHWSAARPDSPLLVGAAAELTATLSRPLTTARGWGRVLVDALR